MDLPARRNRFSASLSADPALQTAGDAGRVAASAEFATGSGAAAGLPAWRVQPWEWQQLALWLLELLARP